MIIRKAANEDVVMIRQLWREIFGDSYKYIDFFLEKRYNSNDCFVCCDNENVVAMLHALPCKFVSDGKYKKCLYLYAIATQKSYRNRGIAGTLINRCIEEGKKDGIHYFCLLPANSSLYSYYAKLGFKPYFFRSVCELTKFNYLDIELFEPDASEIFKIRDTYLKKTGDFISWDEQSLEYGISECRMTGGKVIGFRQKNLKNDMYAFVYPDKSNAVVKEFVGDDIDVLCSAVKKVFTCSEKIKLSLSPAYKYGKTVNYGMLYGDVDKSKFPYLGVALD